MEQAQAPARALASKPKSTHALKRAIGRAANSGPRGVFARRPRRLYIRLQAGDGCCAQPGVSTWARPSARSPGASQGGEGGGERKEDEAETQFSPECGSGVNTRNRRIIEYPH
ncbi:unnamed protein product [Prorocentrum cordatum]|uniref:Uncharacterized protein n=1 Tax=Prorocentrum cordatum TaxID=2364126 RepID=A0ABN9Y946_9DINO|nr:unnamed protein product [Polarella glacialis]